jgi:hypothetical protein
MKKNIIQTVALFLFGATITSCTKTVDIEVPHEGERLVIDASINWEKGTDGNEQIITLSKSKAYFDSGENKSVTGANVRIVKDSDGTIYEFMDQNNGNYTIDHFEPVIGAKYTLEVESEGKTYAAHETLMSVTDIVNIQQTTELGFSAEATEVNIYYQDPIDEKNNYLAYFDPSHKDLPTLWSLNDELTNGTLNTAFAEDSLFEVGDTVEVSLFGTSERFYSYMLLIVFQSSQNFGGPFQTVPVQSKGNCYNVDNMEEEVLGYFRLSEVSRRTHIIE